MCLSAALGLLSGNAFAETRTLKLHFTHTGEKAVITYKRNGKYVDAGLKQANQILRDFRRNEPTKMDPKLLDLVWEVYQKTGSKDYIHVISAYRSPATNGMLRSRGRGVAKNSQHMLGKAMDFFLTDVKLSKLREVGLKMGIGGVGFYPTSGSPFVHLDTGNVRHWPKMSRQELARLFPDGKTLHIPSDGKPLPKYNQALAEYKSKGRTSPVTVASVEAETKKPGFFARLAAKSQEDQSDDEGASDAPEVAAPKQAVLTAAKSAVPAATLEAGVNAPAPPKPAVAGGPVPAADIGAAPETAPLPQEPVGEPFEVASTESDDEIPLDKIPVPSRRPQAPVLAFAATPSPRPLDGTLVVAALSPEEIENMRRTAIPNPDTAPASVAVASIAPATASDAPAGKLAFAQTTPVQGAKAVQALDTITSASAENAGIAAMPAASAAGPSRRTLELALAATDQADTEAAQAIRDLIETGSSRVVNDTVTTPAVAAIPVPQPNPRKISPANAKASPAPVVAAASTAKVGRYALSSAGILGAVTEISAPGYAAGIDKELVVAGIRAPQAAPVVGKFAPAGSLPALTLRTN
ncbi:MAG TPA: DUF882 domain-containing protein [Rhizobiaceae bacterium]|nr:DUF882 domain-containing protein [Rhizobiaceae bacterium]